MALKIKPLLLKCDFIGFIPQFRIFNESRYKSIFSSLLSIILIIFSLGFFLYSFIEYLEQNPKVEYYKNNDEQTNKTFNLSDSIFMFRYDLSCFSNFSEEFYLNIELLDEVSFYSQINFETCEYGQNLDIKFKPLIDKMESIENAMITDFLCLNFNNSDSILYTNPTINSENERYLSFKFHSNCKEFLLYLDLITENDFIDHTKKDNPIVPYYAKNIFFSTDKIDLVYNFDFIKYESEEGIIFSNKKIMNGIGASLNLNERIDFWNNDILSIDFRINKLNYDYYRRTYMKFQSFLADLMSLINTLFSVCRLISELLLYKKIHKDIIRYIITQNEIKKK